MKQHYPPFPDIVVSSIRVALFAVISLLMYFYFAWPGALMLLPAVALFFVGTDLKNLAWVKFKMLLGFGGGVLISYLLIRYLAATPLLLVLCLLAWLLLTHYAAAFAPKNAMPCIIASLLPIAITNLALTDQAASADVISFSLVALLVVSVLIYLLLEHSFFPITDNWSFSFKFNLNPWLKLRRFFSSLTFRPDIIKHWFRLVVACGFITLVQQLLGIQNTSMNAIATTSAVVVLSVSIEATKTNLMRRLGGVTLGAICGFACVMVLNAIPALWLLLLLVAIAMGAAAYFAQKTIDGSAVAPQFAFAFMMAVAPGLAFNASLTLAGNRFCAILYGCLVAYLVRFI